MKLNYEYIEGLENLAAHISQCEGEHTQQARYSTYHGALTQVCFGCKMVRSNIRREQ